MKYQQNAQILRDICLKIYANSGILLFLHVILDGKMPEFYMTIA